MRSDNLARHMKNHVDLSSEDLEKICKSIPEDVINDSHNKDETLMYRENPRVKYLQSDELDDTGWDKIFHFLGTWISNQIFPAK